MMQIFPKIITIHHFVYDTNVATISQVHPPIMLLVLNFQIMALVAQPLQ